ncbi:MAG: MBL fold metallo-hydrolase [Floccifex sp.]
MNQNVVQIKIDFSLTENIQRFVYVYLILGKNCYLIDAGVKGCKEKIEGVMHEYGKNISDLKAIFLTHSHPDHIGGVYELKQASHCKVYIHESEKDWLQDIDLQYQHRPIPNFYNLVSHSVQVDGFIKDQDKIELESNLSLYVHETSGHSIGSVCYEWKEQNILFTGDALPNIHDIPIFVDWKASLDSLHSLQQLSNPMICPAWDRIYQKEEYYDILQKSMDYLNQFRDLVSLNLSVIDICKGLGLNPESINPLLIQSIHSI